MQSEARINEMLDRLIHREGGYVNDPDDPGGETKYGISKRSYPDLDIAALTVEQARDIYWRDFVRPARIDQIRHRDVAEQILDWYVNSGVKGIRSLQKALGVASDGVIGPETLSALNKLKDARMIFHERLRFYAKLRKPKFMLGWINRLIDMGL